MYFKRRCIVYIGDASFEFDIGYAPCVVRTFVEECMDAKRRQPFEVRNASEELLGYGLLYDDGNVQILWRRSIGWTAEQLHSIEKVFGIEEGATVVRVVETLPAPPN